MKLQSKMKSGGMGEISNRNQGLESRPISGIAFIDCGDCRPFQIAEFLLHAPDTA
jgi:hypothetical protein